MNSYSELVDTQIISALEPVALGMDELAKQMIELAEKTSNLKPTQLPPKTINVHNVTSAKTVSVDSPHFLLEDSYKLMESLPLADRNLFYWGKAGSGKSTIAIQFAEGMNLQVYYVINPSMIQDYLGYYDAINDKVVRTQFREAYEHGGVIIFEEFSDGDTNLNKVLAGLALANSRCAFPDGIIERHKDCYIFANGNTPMRGGNEMSQAGKAQDTAVADRFVFIHVGFDLTWERITFNAHSDWTLRVQTLRYHAGQQNLDNIFVITPRAMIKGAALINAGIPQSRVEDMLILKGADETSIGRLYSASGKPAKSKNNVVGFEVIS